MNASIGPISYAHPRKYTVGSCLALGELGQRAVIIEDFLAQQFGRSITVVHLAIARGELPKPVTLMGRNVWTVGVLTAHLETRLEGEC